MLFHLDLHLYQGIISGVNKFVDTMGRMPPTCSLVTRIREWAWEMKEGCGGLGKMKKGHIRKIGSRRWSGR
jgi:hypothetical protein